MSDDECRTTVLRMPASRTDGHPCSCGSALPVEASERWRRPIETGGMRCAYQVILAADGSVYGYEALLRAGSPESPLPPFELFEAAREEGWSTWLDQAARRVAIEGAADWLAGRVLFVNFLPSTVYDPARCLATTSAAAQRTGLAMGQLIFEVVETEAIRDVRHLSSVFAEYRRMGCRVALDDVGSGHNTVDLVGTLAPDLVKLDRDLVRGLPSGATRKQVDEIVRVARGLGAVVLAEGVETSDELAAAQQVGVDLTQGWLHGRPVFADALVAADA
jgi:EAL domain-containing protein (putative c-di-GMP-specific phosphodiesterase class I)